MFERSEPLVDLVERLGVDEIIVAAKEQRGGGVPIDQLLACRIRGVPILDMSGFYERVKAEVPIDSLKASWLVYSQGFVQGPARRAAKRVFDILTSSVLLVLAAPVMVLTALAIKLDSPGPVIYRQERVGLGGRRFMCLKFRSMTVDAEKDGVARWASKNDARVTRVGRFIRKTRIDELPQLLSVLKGEMSMVGPRPERPSFVEELKQHIPFYDLRHSVKPGVTGWAQVRYSYGASLEDARRKHQFDLYYVKNNSLFLDVLVLINAHWARFSDRWQDPVAQERIARALDRFDHGLQAMTLRFGPAVFFDERAWFAARWGGRDGAGAPAYRAVALGPGLRVANTSGDEPFNAVLADGHAGTAWNAMWAASLIDLLNGTWQLRIPAVQPNEIVRLVRAVTSGEHRGAGQNP